VFGGSTTSQNTEKKEGKKKCKGSFKKEREEKRGRGDKREAE